MKKNNYNYNLNQFDDGYSELDFENFDKNVQNKIEKSLAVILLLGAVFLFAALLNYAGSLGDNLLEMLTTSLGVYTYILPIILIFTSYVVYYKKYKLLFKKVFLFLILFLVSLFPILSSMQLTGELGKNLIETIVMYVGEPIMILICFSLLILSFVSILNLEKKAIHLLKKIIIKFFHSFKKLIIGLAKALFKICKLLLQAIFNPSKIKSILNKIKNIKFTTFTIKNKTENTTMDESILELDEEQFKTEEFKNNYNIEVDEKGEEYIVPKRSKSVHEELLRAASVKLSNIEEEKIKFKKLSKNSDLDKLKIHEYEEDESINKFKNNKKINNTAVDEEESYNAVIEEKYEPAPLNLYEEDRGKPTAGDNKANAQTIKRTLQNFQISVEMDEVSVGPTVTRYTLKPAQGVKLSKIAGLDKNLAMDLSTTSIRIEAPIPGKSLVGIEIPNKVKATLGIGTLFASPLMQEESNPLLIALGKDLHGKPVLAQLSKMPHLLIAGTTGSGKSSTIHGLIHSLIYKNSPNHLKFIMIDPKKVELSLYSKLPHLFTPIIKEPKKAVQVLNWLINEMERRYEVLESYGKVNIAGYHLFMHEKNSKFNFRNKKSEANESLERMPYIVVVIDELADFMMAYPKEMESCIVRLAQKSRAVGIHLILSTQRPSTNVITGVIKGNIPARIALKVVSQIDSRVILDINGAEKLLGAGDMLFMNSDGSDIKRIQAPFVSEKEIERVVDYLKNRYREFTPQELAVKESINIGEIQGRSISSSDNGEDLDDRFNEAKDIVMQTRIASVTFLQRKMGIGYGRAAKIIDLLEQKGIVGPQKSGAKSREVFGENNDSDKINNDQLPDDYTPEKDGYLL